MSDKQEEMSIVEHLGELRRRIIYILAVLLLGLVIGLVCANPIYQYLVSVDSAKDFQLHAFAFWDGIGMYMKIAMVVALVLTIPFTAYQLWAFVSPGLREIERKAALRYVPYVFILFLAKHCLWLLRGVSDGAGLYDDDHQKHGTDRNVRHFPIFQFHVYAGGADRPAV